MLAKIRQLILFLGDLLVLNIALYLAVSWRYPTQTAGLLLRHWLFFLPVFIFWLLIFYIDGWYDWRTLPRGLAASKQLLRDSLINLSLAIVFFYFSSTYAQLKPQRLLLIYWLFFTILWLLWRWAFRFYWGGQIRQKRLAIVGTANEIAALQETLKQENNFNYRLALVCPLEKNAADLSTVELIDLPAALVKEKISLLIIPNQNNNPQLNEQLLACLALPVTIMDLPSFYENFTGQIPVSTITPAWLVRHLTENKKRGYEIVKRLADLLIGFFLGLLTLLLLPFLALAIKLSSPGPIFFKQTRLGKNGRLFTAYKLRTMIVEAEKTGPQWAQANDTRVTRIGRQLRRLRLDELPQLYNVCTGDMSLVGPRPERPEFIALLEGQIPYYRQRLLVAPGLTGWAQINYPYGGSVEGSLKKLQYDFYYLKNRSLLLDFSIILRTIKIVLSRFGQ